MHRVNTSSTLSSLHTAPIPKTLRVLVMMRQLVTGQLMCHNGFLLYSVCVCGHVSVHENGKSLFSQSEGTDIWRTRGSKSLEDVSVGYV